MPCILKIDPEKPDAAAIEEAIRILKAGGVIAYPTETFYGLGGDARNEEAVEKIYRIKGRSFTSPLSVIVGTVDGALSLVQEITSPGCRLIEKFWPGPLTLVFHAAAAVSPRLTAHTGKIGIRMSSHPLAALIAGRLSGPVTATSANLSGGKECLSADDVVRCLGDRPDAVIDAGPAAGGKGSTILDLTVHPPTLLREGIIPFADIKTVLHGGE
ncbi:MAG: threonylcarbamoyl-AMP synthase [Deltaproteobacteria bacterium]|nr:threonylcarbamoyl-AMP synthase [Deltaproteobacteria bacterium]